MPPEATLSPDELIQGAGGQLLSALAGEQRRRDALVRRRWRLAALTAGVAMTAAGAAVAGRWWWRDGAVGSDQDQGV